MPRHRDACQNRCSFQLRFTRRTPVHQIGCSILAVKSCQTLRLSAVNAFTVLAYRATKTIDLQSIKQVLCQSGPQPDNSSKTLSVSETYGPRVRACRNRDMSSHCRHFGTRIMTGGHKLLIVKDTATVAEGRQGRSRVTPPNNKDKRKKAHAVCECGSKNTFFGAQIFRAMEPQPLFSRVTGE